MRTLPTVSIGTAALLAAASAALVSHRNLRHKLASTRVELADARELAFRDSLTGLANRAAIDVELARRGAGSEPYAVVLVDLDLFKLVNDTYGHAAGDLVLAETARRLAGVTDLRTDLVGRLGGDEFLILASSPMGLISWQLAQDAASAMRRPITITDGLQVEVTASVGVLHAMPGDDVRAALRSADVALYRAKAAGRNRAVEFGPSAALIGIPADERPLVRLREGGALAGVTR
jgi:diguanylate cyclase (GGDEF)-like protein